MRFYGCAAAAAVANASKRCRATGQAVSLAAEKTRRKNPAGCMYIELPV